MSLVTLAVISALACTAIAGLRPSAPSATLIPGGTIVVYPGNMNGWKFHRGADTVYACADGAMIAGPSAPPAGTGSAMLVAMMGFPTAGGPIGALRLGEFKGTRLDQITALSYSAYRLSEGHFIPTPSLQLVVDYDLNDQATGNQGRLVYADGWTGADSTWNTMDARAGLWYGTQSTVQVNGQNVTNSCTSNSPCTWSQLLAAFPNLGIHSTMGAISLEVSITQFDNTAYVDNLVIGVNGVTTTFDFELTYHAVVPATAPDSIPSQLWDSLTAPANIITDPPGITGRFIRDLIYVQFVEGTSQTDRQSVVDAVQGTVVGGMTLGDPEHFYAIRLPYLLQPGDSSSGPILRALAAMDTNPKVAAAASANMDPMVPAFRKPKDDVNLGAWALSPYSADGPLWAPEAIDAPLAWGCSNSAVDVRSASQPERQDIWSARSE